MWYAYRLPSCIPRFLTPYFVRTSLYSERGLLPWGLQGQIGVDSHPVALSTTIEHCVVPYGVVQVQCGPGQPILHFQ